MALHVLPMLLKEAMQPSSLVYSFISTSGRREHHFIVGRLELFLVSNDCIVRQLANENLSRFGLLGLEMDDAKALGVGLNLLDIAEGRANDILDATCSFPEKSHHRERFAAVRLRDIENSLPLVSGVGFVLPLSLLVALDFERPGVDAQPEAVT